MTISGDAPEPDKTHSISLSRRQAMALGASGFASAIAGCSDLGTGNGGDGETPPPPGSGEEREDARTINMQNPTFDSLEFDAVLVQSIEEHGEIDAIIRAYSSPNLDRENWSKIGETSITQSEGVATYTMDWDLPTGYAQQFHFTIEITAPEQEEETEIYKTGNTIVPFYNAARDENVFKVEPPRKQFNWAGVRDDPFYKTQLWFDTPDESPFNTPEVPEDQYDSNWYEYRNITMTALVRFPSYDHLYTVEEDSREEERGGKVGSTYPMFEWVAFNLHIDAWELLEGFRWNSLATQAIEHGNRKYGNDGTAIDSPRTLFAMMNSDSDSYGLDASDSTDPFETYYASRHEGVEYDRTKTNPLWFASGRPFCKRTANTLEQAFDNPSFNTLDNKEYHKALALQVFIGTNPYTYGISSYTATPEESINGWLRDVNGEDGPGGDCQDATALYNGIASNLLDSTVANMFISSGGNAHELAGLMNLPAPQDALEEWPEHPAPTGGEAFTYETEYGEVSFAEAVYSEPTIGWKPNPSGGHELLTYLTNPAPIHSHIPLTEDLEPDESGSVRASSDRVEIPWEFHENNTTIDDVENFS